MPTKPPSDELAVYARVRAETGRLLGAAEIPDEVREFLLGQWSRLMTGLYMARGDLDPDWRAGWETVSGLIYSLQPKRSVHETEQFLRELPQLLWRLHEGCTALSLPTAERDSLFSHLAMLHAAVARDGLQIGQGGAAPHLGRIEEPGSGQRGGTPAQDQATEMPSLAPGDRVCFLVDGKEKVLVLTGKSPMGGMYLFTNPAGLDAHTFTQARLRAKFRDGGARRLP